MSWYENEWDDDHDHDHDHDHEYEYEYEYEYGIDYDDLYEIEHYGLSSINNTITAYSHYSEGYSYGSESHDKYIFTIANGQVTAAYEIEHGRLEREYEWGTTYQVVGDDVIATEQEGYGAEIATYRDLDGDGYYTKVSEQWVPNQVALVSQSNSNPTPSLSQILMFEGSDSDDCLMMSDALSTFGGAGADQFVLQNITTGHMTASDFNFNEGDRLIIDTGMGIHSREELQEYVTNIRHENNDLHVEFGETCSLTVSGIASHEVSWDIVDILS